MVEASPSPPFEMPEPDLLLEILIVALDAPAQLGGVEPIRQKEIFAGRVESQYLVGSFSPSGHSINSHLSARHLGELVIAMRNANTHTRKARGQGSPGAAFSPFDRAPGVLWQAKCKLLGC